MLEDLQAASISHPPASHDIVYDVDWVVVNHLLILTIPSLKTVPRIAVNHFLILVYLYAIPYFIRIHSEMLKNPNFSYAPRERYNITWKP